MASVVENQTREPSAAAPAKEAAAVSPLVETRRRVRSPGAALARAASTPSANTASSRRRRVGRKLRLAGSIIASLR